MNITQIQIVPVDNGFTIQAVSIDGDKFSRKLVATTVEEARKTLHEIADQFHVQVEKPEKVIPISTPPVIPAQNLPKTPS